MRRDVCFFFQKDVVSVYNAYMAAATNQQFRRRCNQEPYHTISFGLNFSMKYNMNGGACTIHFMPYSNGTAIDMRFSIAQAMGARYNAYAMDLTNTVSQLLGLPSQNIQLDINLFLDDRNKVFAQGQPIAQGYAQQPQQVRTPPVAQPGVPPMPQPAIQPPPQPVQQPVRQSAPPPQGQQIIYATPQPIMPQPAPTPQKRFCAGCGSPINSSQVFCAKCGRKTAN